MASCHTILWWASLTMQMCSISISCQRCRKKLCMFYLPQILKLFYGKEESYWSPFLCPKNNSCIVFSWSIVSCVRMWQVVLGYIVPVAEVTTHIWTYTNIFQMTKEVALTWLDMALTNIGWLNTGSCIYHKVKFWYIWSCLIKWKFCNKIIDVKVRERWENVFLVFSVL